MTREPLYTPPPDPDARVKKLAAVAIGLAVVAGFVRLALYVRNPPPEDLSSRFADLGPFVAFHEVGPAGWAARVEPGWAGITDAALAEKTCAELILRLKPTGDQTVTILGGDGLPVKECVP